MKKFTVAALLAAVSVGAVADITAFARPASSFDSLSSSFTAVQARGSYLQGAPFSFNHHWLLTVDESTRAVAIELTNVYDPRGGLINFQAVTFSSAGGPGGTLDSTLTCSNTNVCTRRFAGNFATSAGTFDLNVVAAPFFSSSYNIVITSIPEPGTALLAGGGLLLLLNRRRAAA